MRVHKFQLATAMCQLSSNTWAAQAHRGHPAATVPARQSIAPPPHPAAVRGPPVEQLLRVRVDDMNSRASCARRMRLDLTCRSLSAHRGCHRRGGNRV